MARDADVRALERDALTTRAPASLETLTRELRRLGLALDECDACWGKGWRQVGLALQRCEFCERGEPKPRDPSTLVATGHARERLGSERMGGWGDRSREVIARVMNEHPNANRQELRALLRAAYPFGQRRLWPYKVWCRCVREALDARS